MLKNMLLNLHRGAAEKAAENASKNMPAV